MKRRGTPRNPGSVPRISPGSRFARPGSIRATDSSEPRKNPRPKPGATESSSAGLCARNVEPSRDLQVLGRGLASIADDLIFDHLALVESAEASAFDGRNVDEYVLVSGRWLDEPVAFSRIEPLDGALLHRRSPGLKPVLTRSRNAAIRATTRFLGRSDAVAPRRRSAGSQNQIADRANTKNWALARPIALSRRRSQVACASRSHVPARGAPP